LQEKGVSLLVCHAQVWELIVPHPLIVAMAQRVKIQHVHFLRLLVTISHSLASQIVIAGFRVLKASNAIFLTMFALFHVRQIPFVATLLAQNLNASWTRAVAL
jgi:hypothetical protein